ncbi:(5-formylfuran-3-yl)methyl phosphate synthase [Jiella sp. M17.18]|uniref:(5-formylfuran-3-yl)methyl phosphate synthase n=1 Tax=Jiella sp. M17.18 TaxID=3234247 RepID=UPI0034E03978
MTKLLASVTGPDEAETVLAGGADIVDLKDPAQGALGAVSPDVIEATIARVAGRRPVSAVAGDLPMRPDAVVPAVEARAAADFVKIGLFPAGRADREAVIAALRPLAERIRLVAVFFADGDFDPGLLPLLAQAGFAGAMIDTMGKDRRRTGGGGLLSHLSFAKLSAFVAEARGLGLMTGLAGSLEPADIPRLLPLQPDYLGFRGALTAGARNAPVDLQAVRRVAAMIAAQTTPAQESGAGGSGFDRIFVRDFTLPLEIGAYGHERGRTQDVRFSVEALVDRIRGDAETIADVYSYDRIIDAIRALAERGHTDLVERLALDLAGAVLSDGRVHEVTVRVEKLELGPRAVGVEIRRGRSDSDT